MENLYSCLLSPMWGLSKKWMEISNILFAKLDQECVAELFLNSIKSKGSLKIMRLHMISYMDAVVKNCEDFAKVYTYVLTKRRISKEDP